MSDIRTVSISVRQMKPNRMDIQTISLSSARTNSFAIPTTLQRMSLMIAIISIGLRGHRVYIGRKLSKLENRTRHCEQCRHSKDFLRGGIHLLLAQNSDDLFVIILLHILHVLD